MIFQDIEKPDSIKRIEKFSAAINYLNLVQVAIMAYG